jgi:hypothetical protein
MYKEAQAAPPPSPIGGIPAVCGSRIQDYLSARPTPPALFLWGGVTLFFYEKFFFGLDDLAC